MKKGSKMSEETKKKISAANKGHKVSEKTREKIRIAHKGVSFSEERKKNISASLKGICHKQTEKTKKKISESKLGVKRQPFNEIWKRKIGIANTGKTHSDAEKKSISERQKGSDNPNWKGGVTEESALARQSKEYFEWRNSVYKRDYWHCTKCGIKCTSFKQAKDKKIVIAAHHIIDFVGDGNTASDYDITNGITACKSCHMKLHNKQRKLAYAT